MFGAPVKHLFRERLFVSALTANGRSWKSDERLFGDSLTRIQPPMRSSHGPRHDPPRRRDDRCRVRRPRPGRAPHPRCARIGAGGWRCSSPPSPRSSWDRWRPAGPWRRSGTSLPPSPSVARHRSPLPSQTSGYVVQPGDTLWSIARRLQPEGDVRALVHQLVAANDGAELECRAAVDPPMTVRPRRGGANIERLQPVGSSRRTYLQKRKPSSSSTCASSRSAAAAAGPCAMRSAEPPTNRGEIVRHSSSTRPAAAS